MDIITIIVLAFIFYIYGQYRTTPNSLGEIPSRKNLNYRWWVSSDKKLTLENWKTVTPEMIAREIETDAFINQVDYLGRTPLHWAVSAKNEGVVNALLEAGADTEIKENYSLNTPLMDAAYEKGDSDILHILVAAGADVNTRNQRDDTPLHWAARMHNPKNIGILIQYGADVNIKNKYDETPLWGAISSADTWGSSDTEIVATIRKLIKLGSNFDGQHSLGYGYHPLIICAVETRRFEVVKILVKNGIDVNETDYSGWTALHYASELRDCKIIDILIKAGADVNATIYSDGYGDRDELNFLNTPLHLAVATSTKLNPAMKILIKAGADIDAKNNHDYTALELLKMPITFE